MRIAFFGTPEFAVPTLAALVRSTHTVVAVVTQPDRPRGRGQRISACPVKGFAVDHGLPVVQPETLAPDPWEKTLAAWSVELGVVAAYGKLLPEWLLALPPRGLINVHASLLPRYRGASPVHRAVMNGDRETGVTIMRVVKALDAGPMLASRRVPIGPDDRTDAVERVLATIGAGLLLETVDRLAGGTVHEVPQDDSQATYAPRLRKDEGQIDWSRPARRIHDQVRGLHPWPHAFTHGPAGRLVIHRTTVLADDDSAALPGTVLSPSPSDTLVVAAGRGRLGIVELQAEGGRVLPARTFLAGHPLPRGTRLGPP